ncbi:MAG: hypothetical protein ABW252_21840 [Polyangiales bacterium]
MRSSGVWSGLGLAMLGLVGCDSDFSARCLIVIDDSDECFDGTTWDAGTSGEDAGVGSDAATPLDAGGDAGIDAAVDDAATSQGPSVSRFCELQFATARAFLESCNCVDSADRDKVSAFVQDVLLYRGTSACIEGFARIAGTTRYEPAAATACASRFDAQFALPSGLSGCSAAGLDIQGLEAVVAKGAQFLAQLPECRQAFVGSVQATAACTASLECAGGLRCLPMPGTPIDAPAGAPRTCQSARRASEACASNSDCADGLVCSGVAVPGRICIEADALRPVGAPCQAPLECAHDWICDSNQCVMPVVDVVCRQ